ncbi:hypothetical protein [Streptomyces sp. cg35]|uniref:hypothetical protein n=1 Tax=Streptomyces sp. cg35 TaxID=3421650 RepID=UPI003D17945A
MTGQPGDHLRRARPAWDVLEDKILVHTRAVVRSGKSPALAAAAHDGIVLCGADALATAGTFDRHTPDMPLRLVDPEGYARYATADQPFQLESCNHPGQTSLFGEDDELERTQEGQLLQGAAASLTPTRYLGPGDRRALDAAVAAVRDIDPQRTILTVPLDQRWLRTPDDLDHLIGALGELPHIKAIVLGASNNPLRTRCSVMGLRRLITGLDRVALVRTDLAGLDAYAHGALFVSIGMQTSQRHIRPPDSGPPRRNGSNVTTAVLHPQLMDYINADKLRDHYGRLPAPRCDCTVCQGRSLLRFDHTYDDQEEANRHNLATWLPWADELQRTAPGADRRNAWQELCRDAVQAHQRLREELADPGALDTPRWLRVWAGEPD